jgi:hypothetical protein
MRFLFSLKPDGEISNINGCVGDASRTSFELSRNNYEDASILRIIGDPPSPDRLPLPLFLLISPQFFCIVSRKNRPEIVSV